MKPQNPADGAAGKRMLGFGSHRGSARIVAVLGVVALVVAAMVFTGAITSGCVAQNAQSLH